MPVINKQSNVTKPSPRKPLSVIDRIGAIDDGDEFLKMNLYGVSGTGKTTLWSTFPAPILAVICSSLSQPGELKSINTPENRRRIKKVVLQSTTEIPDIVDHVKSGTGYKTVVLDHATGLQELALREILGLEELPPQLSWGIATQQQYGQLALKVKELLKAVLDLPTNVVIVAQERNFNQKEGGGDDDIIQPFVASALTPSVVGWLNPACDYVCQTFKRHKTEETTVKIGDKTKRVRKTVKGVEFCLRTAPVAVYASKFRLPKGYDLPEVIVDPSYDKIMDLINGCS